MPRSHDSQILSLDNSGNGKLHIPGFGLPHWFEFEGYSGGMRCRHGANDFRQDRLTAREVAMLRVMNSLTEKPSWHTKIFDDKIVAKWRLEALQMELINDKAWDWCLTELRDKAKQFEATGRVLVLNGESPVSKSVIDEPLRQQLIAATEPLRNVPDKKKDWHPNSDEQVLNLVHPSLYPLVYGKTSVLSEGGQVSLDNIYNYTNAHISPAIEGSEGGLWSKRFQWLPCEVQFDGASDVRITSYINNLHPRHKDLYGVIEKSISQAIDSWNDVLVKDLGGRFPKRISTFGAEFEPANPEEWYSQLQAIENQKEENPDAYNRAAAEVKQYLAQPDSSDYQRDSDTDEDEPDLYSTEFIDLHGLAGAAERKWERIKRVRHPDAGVSYSYDQWKKGQVSQAVVEPYDAYVYKRNDPNEVVHKYYNVDLRKEFEEEGLQVIVKLSSIELTPEKPKYAGGNWHVEGMLNEHIVATAIYYYDVDNVTQSRISFRAEADLDSMDLRYEQDQHEPLAETFGIESLNLRDEPGLQDVGSVHTMQGQLLAFPNTLQHRVEPFELMDKTKSGHRRFLVLWLVDPHYRICSTRNVPAQQHEWWAPEAHDKLNFGVLPSELVHMITQQADQWPMGLDEAKALRLDLMAERTRGQQSIEYGVEQYNFCEH